MHREIIEYVHCNFAAALVWTGLIFILRRMICQATKLFFPLLQKFVFLLLFYPRLSIFCGIFAKYFWQFGHVEVHY